MLSVYFSLSFPCVLIIDLTLGHDEVEIYMIPSFDLDSKVRQDCIFARRYTVVVSYTV